MIDDVKLAFSPNSLQALKVCLGLIMFGVALDITPKDLKTVWKHPKTTFIGLFSQYGLFPFLSFCFILMIEPPPSVALGLLLVASCPGGNVSNFLTQIAGGNTALSVNLTALSELTAFIFTPLVFALWANFIPSAAPLLKQFQLAPSELLISVIILIIIPVSVGILLAFRAPQVVEKIRKPARILSLILFGGFIVLAIWANRVAFISHVKFVFLPVLFQNLIALASGYGLGKLTRLSEKDSRTIAFETGIKNSGLGLVIIFNFFNGLGGMALVAAFWGIWHLFSGYILARLWATKQA